MPLSQRLSEWIEEVYSRYFDSDDLVPANALQIVDDDALDGLLTRGAFLGVAVSGLAGLAVDDVFGEDAKIDHDTGALIFPNGIVLGGKSGGSGIHFNKGDYGFIFLDDGRSGITYSLGKNAVIDDIGPRQQVRKGDPELFYKKFVEHLGNHDYQRGEKVLEILLKLNKRGARQYIDEQYKKNPKQKQAVLAKGIMMYLGGDVKGSEQFFYKTSLANSGDYQFFIGYARAFEELRQSTDNLQRSLFYKDRAFNRSTFARSSIRFRHKELMDSSDYKFTGEIRKRNSRK